MRQGREEKRDKENETGKGGKGEGGWGQDKEGVVDSQTTRNTVDEGWK